MKKIKLERFDAAKYLTDEASVIAFLNDMLAEGDTALFYHALGVVARATGASEIAPSALPHTVADGNRSDFETIVAILTGLGLKLNVQVAPNDAPRQP